jgi:hypothetical protein
VTAVYQTRIISGSPAPADGELSAVTRFSLAELRSFSLSGFARAVLQATGRI